MADVEFQPQDAVYNQGKPRFPQNQGPPCLFDHTRLSRPLAARWHELLHLGTQGEHDSPLNPASIWPRY